MTNLIPGKLYRSEGGASLLLQYIYTGFNRRPLVFRNSKMYGSVQFLSKCPVVCGWIKCAGRYGGFVGRGSRYVSCRLFEFANLVVLLTFVRRNDAVAQVSNVCPSGCDR